MDKHTKPIGLFDSGIGGTSIWSEIHRLLPHENTIYLADSKNAPYGQRPKDEIVSLSMKNTEYLIDLGCKMIVVACNTATTNAIQQLRSKYPVPFIGIEPAIKPAALSTKTQTIGILATQGTLNSELFYNAVAGLKGIRVIEQVGHGLVQLIEDGRLNSPEMNTLLTGYLEPMIEANIDYLVLGCSHYPYLVPQIRKILPPGIAIIDSGEAVARQTKNILEKYSLLNTLPLNTWHQFYTNINTEVLQSILKNEYTAQYKDF
jgi:glutamate racemase